MSLFSGSSGRRLAMMNAGVAQNYQQQIDELLRQAQGMGAGALMGGRADQLTALGQGYDAARGDYGQARDLFNPFAQMGLQAWQLQGDATGLGGAAGYDRAKGAFQASPGYQWQVDQSLDQANRAAAAGGQLHSGNAAVELQSRASNLANQEYGNWFNRVSGIADRGYGATTAQAGLQRGMGDLASGYGSAQAGVYGDTAGRLAGLYGGVAGQRSNALTNLSGQLIDANSMAYKGGQDAQTNKLNLILGLANTAASLGGGWAGGGFKKPWA